MLVKEFEFNLSSWFSVGDYFSSTCYVMVDRGIKIIKNGQVLQHELSFDLVLPRVTILNEDLFLISEYDLLSSDIAFGEDNAWIINNEGKIVNKFCIGQANRLISTDKYIIANYSRSGYSEGVSPIFESGGLAVFDFKGNCLHHFETILPKMFNFFEIYSMSIISNRFVYFQAYPDFHILKLDLHNFNLSRELIFVTDPDIVVDDFWIPKAISKRGDDWYFLSPNRESGISVIFKMDEMRTISEIGRCNYCHSPKGLSDGRFFVPTNDPTKKYVKCQLIEVVKNSIKSN